jgi:hypothetical protein
MKKIRLDVATLRVDSFDAGAEPAAQGTVLAHATRRVDTCAPTCQTNCDCTLGCTEAVCTTV